jgi:1-acyl-sn-glycerol-3-phosphate acyltransferase
VVGQLFKKFKRPHVKIMIGKPFTLPPLPKENRAAFLQEQTDEIMAQIAALLPEKYRGIYAEKPRVKQLVSSSRTA